MSGLVEWAVFLALSAVAVSTAAGMLLTMSMYRAGLALMSSFVALAGLFILLDADLLAAVQVMMNVGGMLVMVLFMVMLMIDPGGEMMWDMKRRMHLPGPGAFSMSMPRTKPPAEPARPNEAMPSATDWTCPMHPEVSASGPGDCPICGMPLVPRTELQGGDGASAPPRIQTWTCPMHPEVRENQPGQCPICGMDLVAVEEAAPAPAAAAPTSAPAQIWTCPMHPEIRQDDPGQCPICGMDLVPAEGDGADTSSALGAGHGAHADTATAGADGHEGMEMHSDRAGGARAMAMPAMSPRQHYQMMVDMAMSTAQLPWALAVGAATAAILIVLVVRTDWRTASTGPTEDATPAVGDLLLGRYMVAFEGAAFLILAGIVGAVIFAKRERVPRPVRVAPAETGIYTCPMHPEVRHEGPGQCPICGMDLVPAQDEQEEPTVATQPQESQTYTCPMHPEVRQQGPGRCPKCGMNLVPAQEGAPAGGSGHGGHA